jgi:hypothetical protein
MSGFIQKILINNSNYNQDYFLDKMKLIDKLIEENNNELVSDLMKFIELKMLIHTKIDEEFGGSIRVSVGKFFKPLEDSIYYHYKFDELQWNFLNSLDENIEINKLRDTLFPKLGWNHLGFRKIINPIPYLMLNDHELLSFENFNDIKNIWDRSTII